MDLCFKNRLSVGATTISNNFIDHYMAGASGEYVKVYLYLLRHQEEIVTVEAVADALDHTEADVRRALAYWQRAGVLAQAENGDEATAQDGEKDTLPSADAGDKKSADMRGSRSGMSAQSSSRIGYTMTRSEEVSQRGTQDAAFQGGTSRQTTGGEAAARETAISCDMTQLAADESFCQLTYIAEKYLNRVLTQTDCQILGNLYMKLQMAPELLEYLIEYCVQNHHTSLRYMEKVALSWHDRKIRTVEEARAYAQMFSRDFFAVMKAMGLNGRNPADSEIQLMEKWFREYGFTKEIVVEACTRTMQAIHKPSFQYADRILSDWKQAGVRAFRDVAVLDKQRKEQGGGNTAGGKQEQAGGSSQNQNRTQNPGSNRRGRTNRFHNLEEHGYDYDEMVWNMINSGPDTGGEDGTQ